MNQTALDVAVIGNAGIDTNIYLPGAEIDFSVEANFTENLDMIGQAGGYASRGYARLGKRTAFIGYTGDDFGGRYLRQEFEAQGIDTQALFVDPAGASRSVNIVYRDGRRRNFYDGKSHMTLQPDLQICRQVLARCRLAHFNIPNWARLLLPLARELGLVIACDIQDVVSLADAYRHDFIRQADFLFFSAANHAQPEPLIEGFLQIQPRLLVICGMGERGCALASQHGLRFYPPEKLDAPVVDSNGAGDSLAVGFLSSYLLDGFSLEQSIRRGQLAARTCCSQSGRNKQLITRQELDRLAQLS
jgi:sugar/nucleoside kinase (ribokinase family)